MLEKIYQSLISTRNFFYDADILDALKLNKPVLSVGNLTAGGSGKTPMVDYLLRHSKKLGLNPLVVSKNYKALSQESLKVNCEHPMASHFYGDEAVMLASRYPEFQFWTGPKKYQTAELALIENQKEETEIDFIILDDGFQHRELNRDFDLVLVDASTEMKEWSFLPKGRMREGWDSLKRADAIVLTKINEANESVQSFLEKQIEKFDLQIAKAAYIPQIENGLREFERVILVSGIAKPQSFFRTVKSLGRDFEVDVADHVIFPDHHKYSISDLDRIFKIRNELGVKRILTTEKDFIKLKNLGVNPLDFDIVRIQVEWIQESEKLNEFFSRFSRT